MDCDHTRVMLRLRRSASSLQNCLFIVSDDLKKVTVQGPENNVSGKSCRDSNFVSHLNSDGLQEKADTVAKQSPQTPPREQDSIAHRTRSRTRSRSKKSSSRNFLVPRSSRSDTKTPLRTPRHVQATSFEFDHVFKHRATSEEVFASVRPAVESVLDGTNATIVASGCCASGKTHTMFGPLAASHVDIRRAFEAKTIHGAPECVGLVQKTLAALFARIADRRNDKIEVNLSFVDLYKDELRDLLNTESYSSNLSSQLARRLSFDNSGERNPCDVTCPDIDMFTEPSNVRIVSKKDGMIELIGSPMLNQPIRNIYEALQLVESGFRARAFSQGQDEHSFTSMSHVLLLIDVSVPFQGKMRTSRLSLVDLAGAVSIDDVSAANDEFVFARQCVNLSLTAFYNVLSALASHRNDAWMVGYRNSKLTHILRNSLGGRTRTILLAHAIDDMELYAENMQCLFFASRAREVRQTVQSSLVQEQPGVKTAKDRVIDKLLASIEEKSMELQAAKSAEAEAETLRKNLETQIRELRHTSSQSAASINVDAHSNHISDTSSAAATDISSTCTSQCTQQKAESPTKTKEQSTGVIYPHTVLTTNGSQNAPESLTPNNQATLKRVRDFHVNTTPSISRALQTGSIEKVMSAAKDELNRQLQDVLDMSSAMSSPEGSTASTNISFETLGAQLKQEYETKLSQLREEFAAQLASMQKEALLVSQQKAIKLPTLEELDQRIESCKSKDAHHTLLQLRVALNKIDKQDNACESLKEELNKVQATLSEQSEKVEITRRELLAEQQSLEEELNKVIIERDRELCMARLAETEAACEIIDRRLQQRAAAIANINAEIESDEIRWSNRNLNFERGSLQLTCHQLEEFAREMACEVGTILNENIRMKYEHSTLVDRLQEENEYILQQARAEEQTKARYELQAAVANAAQKAQWDGFNRTLDAVRLSQEVAGQSFGHARHDLQSYRSSNEGQSSIHRPVPQHAHLISHNVMDSLNTSNKKKTQFNRTKHARNRASFVLSAGDTTFSSDGDGLTSLSPMQPPPVYDTQMSEDDRSFNEYVHASDKHAHSKSRSTKPVRSKVRSQKRARSTNRRATTKSTEQSYATDSSYHPNETANEVMTETDESLVIAATEDEADLAQMRAVASRVTGIIPSSTSSLQQFGTHDADTIETATTDVSQSDEALNMQPKRPAGVSKQSKFLRHSSSLLSIAKNNQHATKQRSSNSQKRVSFSDKNSTETISSQNSTSIQTAVKRQRTSNKSNKQSSLKATKRNTKTTQSRSTQAKNVSNIVSNGTNNAKTNAETASDTDNIPDALFDASPDLDSHAVSIKRAPISSRKNDHSETSQQRLKEHSVHGGNEKGEIDAETEPSEKVSTKKQTTKNASSKSVRSTNRKTLAKQSTAKRARSTTKQTTSNDTDAAEHNSAKKQSQDSLEKEAIQLTTSDEAKQPKGSPKNLVSSKHSRDVNGGTKARQQTTTDQTVQESIHSSSDTENQPQQSNDGITDSGDSIFSFDEVKEISSTMTQGQKTSTANAKTARMPLANKDTNTNSTTQQAYSARKRLLARGSSKLVGNISTVSNNTSSVSQQSSRGGLNSSIASIGLTTGLAMNMNSFGKKGGFKLPKLKRTIKTK